MSSKPTENVVALYWDFENLHACVVDSVYGRGAYSDNYARNQPSKVDVAAIVNYAASVGIIAINRAYNHWQRFGDYSGALNENGLDLIQLYPIGAKNGADIRLALDVIEDLQRFQHITHVIVVSSDRDYIGLAQKVKQLGRTIIGVGVRDNTNPYWVKCCNEFKFYENLVARTVAGPSAESLDRAAESLKHEDARALLLRSMRDLVARGGSETVSRSHLKLLMVRHDPAFDESALNFPSFSRFIDAFPDLVENIYNESGGSVRLLRDAATPPEGGPPVATEADGATAAVEVPPPAECVDPSLNYAQILKRGNFRVLPAPWWRLAVTAFERAFEGASHQQFATFDDLCRRVAELLGEENFDNDAALVGMLRLNLFALRLFQLFPDRRGVGLSPDPTRKSLLERVDEETVRRLVRFATPPLNEAGVSCLLFGEATDSSLVRTRELIQRVGSQSTDSTAPSPAPEMDGGSVGV